MRWVVIAVAALLVGLLTYGVASNGTDTTIESALANGKSPQAPDQKLPTLGSDTPGRLADFKGKVVLVNFWASWCKPCTEELPDLQRVQKTMAKAGATVLGINTRDASEDAQHWVDQNHLTYPSLRDGSGDFAKEWGVTAYPESFLVDKTGHIKAAIRGPLDAAWINQHVIPLLNS
jgi:cytochrome c biogenesis protein CcmG/thiol:disulfide interchange protein DsbE